MPQHRLFVPLAQARDVVLPPRNAYHEPMPITVELFGIPRARAGMAKVTVHGKCLGEALVDLATHCPELAPSCLDGQNLRPGYTANLRGERFVTDPETPLTEGDTLLLMALDAGG